MRKLIFNLHLLVALIAGAFVFVLGVTGAIMAFENELGEWFHAGRVFVTPGPQTLSLAELSSSVLKSFPGEHVRGFRLATRPNRSFAVVLRERTVFVNPYTGTVLGVQSGPDRVAETLNTIHQLHLRLLIRNKADTGKEIIRWSGSGMIILLLSGLYLWWPQKRIWVTRWNLADVATRAFWYDLHNAVGILSTVFLLVLAITGVAIGFEKQTMTLFKRITHTEPAFPPDAHSTPSPGASPISPDRAVEIARAAVPGAAPFDINIPDPEGVYRIRSRFPEDLTGGGRSYVMVDQYSGKVLFALGSRTAPASVRLLTLNRALHTGDIFGTSSKVLMSMASLAAAFQMLSGIVMLWKRIRKAAAPAPSEGQR